VEAVVSLEAKVSTAFKISLSDEFCGRAALTLVDSLEGFTSELQLNRSIASNKRLITTATLSVLIHPLCHRRFILHRALARVASVAVVAVAFQSQRSATVGKGNSPAHLFDQLGY
jgi:hypothetical protein